MHVSPRLGFGLLVGGVGLLLLSSSSTAKVSTIATGGAIASKQVDPNDLAKAAVAQAQAQVALGDGTVNGKLLKLAQAAQKAGYTQAAATLMAGGGTTALLGVAQTPSKAVALTSPAKLTLVAKVA